MNVNAREFRAFSPDLLLGKVTVSIDTVKIALKSTPNKLIKSARNSDVRCQKPKRITHKETSCLPSMSRIAKIGDMRKLNNLALPRFNLE